MPPTGIRHDGGRKRSHQRAKGGDKWCPDGSAQPFSDLSGGRQVVTPKSAPTAAVTAIASAVVVGMVACPVRVNPRDRASHGG